MDYGIPPYITEDTILIVRHAQATHHLNGLTGGWTDSKLTGLGHNQAARAAERLAIHLDGFTPRLVSSDQTRAMETASYLSSALATPILSTPELREFNNGIAANQPQAEADRLLLPRGSENLDWQPYPEAETWRQFFARVASGMEKILAEKNGPWVLVSHGGTIGNIIAWWLWLDAPALDRIFFRTDPASLSILGISEFAERTLFRLNDTAHLSGLAPR
jgi:broad specificity phosphatase PhoE